MNESLVDSTRDATATARTILQITFEPVAIYEEADCDALLGCLDFYDHSHHQMRLMSKLDEMAALFAPPRFPRMLEI